jgi:2-dehydropantoate 2-reductase
VRIVVLGSGTQGTLYGVRLASAGHTVTLVARGRRAEELRTHGAVIEHALTGERTKMTLPVAEELGAQQADLCLVTVRREQLEGVLPVLAEARGVARTLFMVNHACGSGWLFDALGRERTILGFPGAAGSIEAGTVRYLEVIEQPTVLEAAARDIISLFEQAGFRVSAVGDVDSWLRRHAVFVTAACGALYEEHCDARRLASDRARLGAFVQAVREGWRALDDVGVAPPPIALRTIFRWVPLSLAVHYWAQLFASRRGEFYFARHARHAVREMAALADDILALAPSAPMPHWRRLHTAITTAAATQA